MAFDIRSRENLVAALKKLRFQTITKTNISNSERELIEGLSLSSKPLSADRIMGGSPMDAHELQSNIIGMLDISREQLARTSREIEDKDLLIRQIQSLPAEYKWILTAQYIDEETEIEFCEVLGLEIRSYYRLLHKAIDLLFRIISEQ